MKKGFTLIELLAVIVILAILALIATPVVIDLINDSRESSKLRSAEMYLDAVEQAILRENMSEVGNFIPTQCDVVDKGNLSCDGSLIAVEVDGEVPDSGTISFQETTILNISLVYDTETIVMNENGNLDYQ